MAANLNLPTTTFGGLNVYTSPPLQPKPIKIDFDPNTMPEPEYATFVPGRRPKFKHHTTRSTALNAARWHREQGVVLYRWDKSARAWIELFRCVDWKCRKHCDLCKAPTAAGWVAKHVWAKNFATGKIDEPLRLLKLCSICYSQYRT